MPKKEKASTLHQLFINKLNVLLDIETQLMEALPKMADHATDEDLKAGFEEHLEETRHQAERLKQCLQLLDEKPEPLESEAIRGLIADGEWVIKNVQEGAALDANLIAAAQYVEHYEMAGYKTAIEWAKVMGHDEVQQLLEEILAEEEAANENLQSLALNKINEEVEAGM